jgi:hypothetical protein
MPDKQDRAVTLMQMDTIYWYNKTTGLQELRGLLTATWPDGDAQMPDGQE